MTSGEAVTIHSLERLAAERVTKQTLVQLDAMAVFQLLKEADKLQDVLRFVASHDLPTFVAALPPPTQRQKMEANRRDIKNRLQIAEGLHSRNAYEWITNYYAPE